MLSQTDENVVDIVSVTTDKLDGIDKNLQTYVDILNTFSLVTGSASDLADSAQTLILNTQGLFNSSQDTVSSMHNSVLSGAQTADTVSSLISISLDSMDQDLSVLDEQVDGLSEGDTYSTVQNSTESVKKVTGSTLTVLKDVLGETDKKLSAVDKSYKQLEIMQAAGLRLT